MKFHLLEFEGIVTKKFVDEDNHGDRKVVFKNANKTDVLFLNFENDLIFNSFKIGDTIVKKPNTLNFTINQKSEKFNFDSYINRGDFDENLDSIISDYLQRKDIK